MKLIWCHECNTLTSLVAEKTRYCKCRKCCGKYLKDNMTSVINKKAILVGVDNNTFNFAVHQYCDNLKYKERLDGFFSGWIPNHPGESIEVLTIKEVRDYPYEEEHDHISTMPVSKGS